MRELKFCGAMINGHTNGQYLDHPSLAPFWERAEALQATIYIHPTDPVTPAPVLDGHDGLRRATWEWGFETGSHALRLVFTGLFDRFPRARLALGHLGETLPYLLWRFDSRAKLYGVKLKKQPSDYIRENMVVTNSGMYSAEPLACALAALGHDRVMFGADYPFEAAHEGGEFLDRTPLDDAVRTRRSPPAMPSGISACLTAVMDFAAAHDQQSSDRRPARRHLPRPAGCRISASCASCSRPRAAALPKSVSEIDVLIGFGVDLKEDFFRAATGLKWIQCLATGVDHLVRQPALKPDIVHHQRARHPRRADARNGGLSDDGGEPRRAAAGRRPDGARLGPALLEPASTARPRSWSASASSAAPAAQLLKAFGMHVIGVTRRRARSKVSTKWSRPSACPRRLRAPIISSTSSRQPRTIDAVRRQGVRRHEADRLLYQRRPRARR